MAVLLWTAYLCLLAGASATTTTEIGSCEGMCGFYAGGCYCDTICVWYGDCCSDYTEHCISVAVGECGEIFTGDSGLVSSPGYPEPYLNGTECVWIINATETKEKVHIAFSDINITETDCRNNHIEVFDGESWLLLASYCGSGLPEPLTTNGSVLVIRLVSTPQTPVSFSASWEKVCENHLAGDGRLTSPSYPRSYPPNKDCSYIIEGLPGETITINFTDIRLDRVDDLCDEDYVEIRDGGSEFSPLVSRLSCDSEAPIALTSTQNFMWLRFFTDNSSDANSRGFDAEYTSAPLDCRDGNLTGETGVITSPGYPHAYPNHARCEWTIKVESHRRVRLTFTNIQIYGWGQYCYGDYVSVYDVTEQGGKNLIAKYCGSLSSSDVQPILSTANELVISFVSDFHDPFFWFNNPQIGGFEATYRVIIANDEQPSLFPFGDDAGDLRLPLGNQKSHTLPHIENGIPVGTGRQVKAYVSANGLLTFGSNFVYPELRPDKMMVCAYASYIDLSKSEGGVYYQLYTEADPDRSVLDKATLEVRDFTKSESFTAIMVLLVTWDNVTQMNGDGEVTFQLAIITDGMISYALILHRVGHMKWQAPPAWQKIAIGVSDGGNKVQKPIYSGTLLAYSIDKQLGNTGRYGTWMYKLGETAPSPEMECITWYHRNRDEDHSHVFPSLPQCPCSLRDVWRRTRFTWTHSRYDDDGKVQCYRLTRSASRRFHPYSKECCYWTYWGNAQTADQVILDPPYAGSALAFNPAYWSLVERHQRDDRQGHDTCCKRSSNTFCERYYELRPTGQCQPNIPFRFSWMFGDPHITTLDGARYTFNGWGEYTMVSIATEDVTFVLQSRTSLAETENGTLTNATIFTAFGAEHNETRVFVQLEPNSKDTMVVYAGGIDYSRHFNDEANFLRDEDDFTLTRDNDSLVVTFPSSISLTVSISMKALDISITMPLHFQNQTRGLLGNFNGVQGDDFVLPDGTVLQSNLSERQIFEDFGQFWSVTKTNRSVMRYGDREGPANYSHPDFVPLFLDEQPEDVRQEAEELCGDADLACVFDFIATRSAAFANATRLTKDTVDSEEQQSKNSVPQVTVATSVNVTSGNVTVQASATDDDEDDTLTFGLVDDCGGRYSINPATGVINAVFNESFPVSLRVYATDSKGAQSPVMVVNIHLCPGCGHHGHCDFTRLTQVSEQDSNFLLAACVCDPGYTGQYCEQELNPCLDQPCLPHQTCTPWPVEDYREGGLGYNCTGCLGGLASQGSVCVDVDECGNEQLNDCDDRYGVCNNTWGSYSCSCQTGYRLSGDGHSCFDVNECVERRDGCEQRCVNSEGSYSCLCHDSYTLAEDGKNCTLNVSASHVCDQVGCEHGCSPVLDPTTQNMTAQCFCRPGFELDANGTKCMDIDECEKGLCSQTCLNTVGSFACSCHKGYKLAKDGRTCDACDELTYGLECRLTCDCNGRGKGCDHVTGCVCEDGWRGQQCEEDVDECEESEDLCGERQECHNTEGSYTCSCLAGYHRDADGVCRDVDECAEGSLMNACGELEQCTNVPGTFHCSCLAGYHHVNETCVDVDECTMGVSACQQKCTNVAGSYNCECNYGYRLNADRATCVQVTDVCASFENLNCSHGCTLNDHDLGVCFCDSGFTLQEDAQTCRDIDECAEGLANCSHTCNNTIGGFFCTCPVGMTLDNDGRLCNECPAGTFGEDCSRTCACIHGQCNATTGCVCDGGWTGPSCDRDINECDHNVTRQECQAMQAQCVNYQGGYRCRCLPGYTEGPDGICQDVDECESSPCGHVCENSVGSYSCLCNAGFTLADDGHLCEDVDECALTVDNQCTQHCENTAGSYLCSCTQPGFILDNDGVSCVTSTSCTQLQCDQVNGGCTVDKGNETCFCNSGYTLHEENSTCIYEDVDWCAEGHCQQDCSEAEDGRSFTCSCWDGFLLNSDLRTCRPCPQWSHGADCNQTCSCFEQNTQSCNTSTGQCQCRPGWTNDTCHVDVNECMTSPQPCPDHSICANTEGSFLCHCEEGFYKAHDICRDLDECQDEVDDCEQLCVNVIGSYQCECWDGYTPTADGNTCKDVDECQTDNGGCDHNCTNTVGSFQCSCDTGYLLGRDGASCEECSGFHYGPGCQHTCPCTQDNTDSCDHVTGSCTCSTGWEGDTCGDDVDECDGGGELCPSALERCENTPGSFQCVCVDGAARNMDGVCVEYSRLQFELEVNIDIDFDEDDPTSAQYISIEEKVKQTLTHQFNNLRGFVGVNILSLRHGSVICSVEALADQEFVVDFGPQLAMGLIRLNGQDFTIGGARGSATVTVDGVEVEADSSVCDVMRGLGVCNQPEQVCEESGGQVQCKIAKVADPSPSDSWIVLVSVSVAVPGAALVIGGIACCVGLRIRKRMAKKETTRPRHGRSGGDHEVRPEDVQMHQTAMQGALPHNNWMYYPNDGAGAMPGGVINPGFSGDSISARFEIRRPWIKPDAPQ